MSRKCWVDSWEPGNETLVLCWLLCSSEKFFYPTVSSFLIPELQHHLSMIREIEPSAWGFLSPIIRRKTMMTEFFFDRNFYVRNYCIYLSTSMPINFQVCVVIKMFPTKIYFTNMDPFPSSYRKSKYKNIPRKMEIYKFLPLKVPPIVSFNRCCLVQLLSPVWLFAIPWTAAYHASLSIINSWSSSSQWCYPAISSSDIPFSSCLQSFPASGSFPVSRLFASSSQSIRASASSSVLSMNIQGWFPLGRTDLISLQSKGLSRVFSSITVWKHQFFGTQPSL